MNAIYTINSIALYTCGDDMDHLACLDTKRSLPQFTPRFQNFYVKCTVHRLFAFLAFFIEVTKSTTIALSATF